MDVRQLAAIVAVADHGTFSAAARALFTVQSNVSGHVAKLERELGATLVDRTNGVLTEEGERVVERARRVLHEIDDIAADIASLGDDVSGDARIGVIGTTARWLMPQLLGAVERERDHRACTQSSARAARARSCPASSRASSTRRSSTCRSTTPSSRSSRCSPRTCCCSSTPTTRSPHDAIHLTELEDVPLLLPPKGAALRRVLDRAASAADTTLRAQAEIDGVRLLASLAFDGYGAAIVPATAAPSQLAGDFKRITVPELPRRVVAWVRRRRPAPSAATAAVEATLLDVVRTHADTQPGVHLGTELLPLRTN